ncbi:MAG: hypothetical protein OWS03_09515 [Alicyclobacillaceae bacterium]|nr:hypothetical protein [Alicyclobacillaceae bacterium]
MPAEYQKILILCLTDPDFESPVVAWSMYDPTIPADQLQMQTGDSNRPPYATLLDAMRDGWCILQVPHTPHFVRGHEYETGHLPYEYILEKRGMLE